MRISEIKPKEDFTLQIILEDGHKGIFDITPYLEYDAFNELKNIDSFKKVMNGGYYIEWDCGADLSVDTIEAHLKIL